MPTDVSKLSDSELLMLLHEKQDLAASQEAMQQALKIALNSLD